MYRYETIIIGAGIAGTCIAYTLAQQNHKVLVVDKKGIASGGSGAAGAFISPKIGKGSALQRLTNKAFVFAKDFYLSESAEYFHQTGIVRIPKDSNDAKKFNDYEKFNDINYERYTKNRLNMLGIDVEFDSFFFPEAGYCDASKVCEYLLRDIDVETEEIRELIQENGGFRLLASRISLFAKNVVLATGFENNLLDLRYMGIRGTWGTRGDYSSGLNLNISMHKTISVGANIDGIIKLGATHEKIIQKTIPCNKKMALSLKQKASQLIDASDLKLVKSYCGMRAGSKDYFPLVGRVIDTYYMLEFFPSIVTGAKPALSYIDNLYVFNGLGGRGFVFAPLMAKMLAEYIVYRKEIDKMVNPDRLFFKWARRLKNNSV